MSQAVGHSCAMKNMESQEKHNCLLGSIRYAIIKNALWFTVTENEISEEYHGRIFWSGIENRLCF